jgi:hypothetical protein
VIYIVHNAWPILLAASAALLFGGAWYSVFGTPWTRNARLEPDRARPPSLVFLLAFVCEAWIAAILAGALILAPVEAGGWTVALGTAFILWVGFVLPVIVVDHRTQRLPWTLTGIDAGHWLGAFAIIAAVLQAVGVAAP